VGLWGEQWRGAGQQLGFTGEQRTGEHERRGGEHLTGEQRTGGGKQTSLHGDVQGLTGE